MIWLNDKKDWVSLAKMNMRHVFDLALLEKTYLSKSINNMNDYQKERVKSHEEDISDLEKDV